MAKVSGSVTTNTQSALPNLTHLTKNVINIEKTRSRESKLLIVGQGFLIFFTTARTFI